MKINNFLLIAGLILLFTACTDDNSRKQNSSLVKHIKSMTHLQKVVNKAQDRLLIFDLYADWCAPCRRLAPLLEEVAAERKNRVSVYKIDTEKHRDIAASFGVRGIPYVVFIRNRSIVHTLTGLHPKEKYLHVIDHFYKKSNQSPSP
ncbi:MAG TPA: thioredoxin domain-containing protein [Spirochaetota bacterium]|nr:thioredoxin domain-containing protein [Spirochaetota bacterium]